MTLAEYFLVPYKAGARGPREFDCWGWVRMLRHEVYGKRLLPEYPGITQDDVEAMDAEYRRALTQSDDYVITQDQEQLAPGTVVCVLRGGLCLHIGTIIEVDGELNYAETSRNGVRRMTLANMNKAFSGSYYELVFFNDHD